MVHYQLADRLYMEFTVRIHLLTRELCPGLREIHMQHNDILRTYIHESLIYY